MGNFPVKGISIKSFFGRQKNTSPHFEWIFETTTKRKKGLD